VSLLLYFSTPVYVSKRELARFVTEITNVDLRVDSGFFADAAGAAFLAGMGIHKWGKGRLFLPHSLPDRRSNYRIGWVGGGQMGFWEKASGIRNFGGVGDFGGVRSGEYDGVALPCCDGV